jgi:hypothetical protein
MLSPRHALRSVCALPIFLGTTITSMSSEPHEQVSTVIVAEAKDNDTGIDVAAGASYEVRVHRIVEPLVDGKKFWKKKVKGLEGWDNWLLRPLAFKKRQPKEPFYALIGTVDGADAARLVEYDPKNAARTLYVPKRGGRLHCYFNDWPSRYCNNEGKIVISLRRAGGK